MALLRRFILPAPLERPGQSSLMPRSHFGSVVAAIGLVDAIADDTTIYIASHYFIYFSAIAHIKVIVAHLKASSELMPEKPSLFAPRHWVFMPTPAVFTPAACTTLLLAPASNAQQPATPGAQQLTSPLRLIDELERKPGRSTAHAESRHRRAMLAQAEAPASRRVD